MKKDRVLVGIIGFGTVGTGTVRLLLENKELLTRRLGFPIKIKKIADIDIKRKRGLALPKGMLTTNADEIISDPEIDIVVELIGGIQPAKDFILKAIRSGKHIVTANKALLALEGNEIFDEAERVGVEIGYEASVAGGIPIIKVIKEGLIANRILSIYGIINGTSNYILTKMTDEGIEFKDALREAQKLGYAEADPTLDIEGIDSGHKLTILASLAYGIPLSFNKVYTEGITRITPQDIEFGGELGYKIKLLAIARCTNQEVELRVHPTMLPKEHLISKIDGVFNAIYVEGDAVGETLYYGRGAGDMPTGSAVVSDISGIAKNIMLGAKTLSPGRKKTAFRIKGIDEIESMYYFRFSVLDRPGVLSRISGFLGENNISIASVIQKGRRVGEAVPVIILTHMAKEKDIIRAVKKIDSLPVVTAKTYYIRVEGNG